MAMTLKQAFTLWAYDQKNTVLAAKSRDAVQRVLMKKWNDIDLEQVTEPFARKIFTTSSAPQELKAKAASVLVQLLQWGSEKGHCQPPSFTYGIASEDYGKQKQARRIPRPVVVPTPAEVRQKVLESDENPAELLVKVKPEALARRKAELAARNEPNTEKNMEQKNLRKSGRKPRPLAQIDPHTLDVVKIWPAMKEAERALNACNLDRAAKMIRKAAGFYWSDAAEVSTFRERLDAKERGIKPEGEKPLKVDGKDVECRAGLNREAPAEPYTPKFKVGDHVLSRDPDHKDLSGVMGLVTAVHPEKMAYDVAFGDGQWWCLEKDIELADEDACQSRRTFTAMPGVEDISVRNVERDALEVFADEELWKELERRGWQGEISKLQVIKMGK